MHMRVINSKKNLHLCRKPPLKERKIVEAHSLHRTDQTDNGANIKNIKTGEEKRTPQQSHPDPTCTLRSPHHDKRFSEDGGDKWKLSVPSPDEPKSIKATCSQGKGKNEKNVKNKIK